MPIHNEAKFLPYSLPSIYRLKPDEVLLLFDRCTDNSPEIAKKMADRHKYASRTRFIEINEPSPRWKFRIAFVRRQGFKIAKNHVILNTDADTMLSEEIADAIPLIGKSDIGMVKFGRRPYPRTLQSYLGTLISPFLHVLKGHPAIGFAAIYAFSKEAWLATENPKLAKNVLRAEDTHLYSSISKKYKAIFIETRTLHLRPQETKENHFLKGVTRWQVKRAPLWMVVAHTFMFLRPPVLSGYLKARLQSKEFV